MVKTLIFISSEITTSVRELEGAVNRLASFSRIYKKIPNLSAKFHKKDWLESVTSSPSL